jgi:hypothetical protein
MAQGRRKRVAARLAAIAVLATAVVGCGSSTSGGSLSVFAAGYSKDRVQFRQLGTALANALGGAQSRTDTELANELARLAKRARTQVAKLKQLDPPAKYRDHVNELTAGLSAVALDLQRISRAAVLNDAQTASEATQALIVQSARVKAADVAISDALQAHSTS